MLSFEGRGAKVAKGSGEGSGDSEEVSVCEALERSLRFVGGIGSLGGVSSFEAYPAHFRPKFAQRKQFGFVSSHLTRRALFI